MNRKVIGLHACLEVFKVRPGKINRVLLKKDWKHSTDLKKVHELASREHIKIQEVHPQELDKIASGHQGICLEVSATPTLTLDSKTRFIIGLDGVEDPQNLG